MAAKKFGEKRKKKMNPPARKEPSGNPLLKRSGFSRSRLIFFVVIFAVIGGIILLTTLAAGNSKVWDTQADFSSGTLSNTTATSAGHVTLAPSTSGGSGTNVSLPTYEIHVEPYNYDPTGSISAGQGFYWNSFRSPSTEHWVTSGNYRTIRVNGHGNSYMGSTSDYQDDWWVAWQDYFPSSMNDSGSVGWMKNFHNTPGDIGWDATAGVSGVSSVATQFDPGANIYSLHLLDGYGADKRDFDIYQPTRNTWHSVLMHVVFGRAESGLTPKKGRVQVWVDGNNTPAVDTDIQYPNGVSTIAKPSTGTYAGQLQQKIMMFEGGPYNLKWQGSAPAIHDTTAMQFGTTLSAALSDTPTFVTGWGGKLIPNSPTIEAGHPDAYELPLASRNSNQFQVPSSLGGTGGTTTYPSSGSVTLSFDAGAASTWDSVTPVQTTPSGTSISYQYRSSADNSTWSAWTSALSSAPANRYFQVMATLATSNTSATPDLDKLTLNYTPQTGGGGGPSGVLFGTSSIGANTGIFPADHKYVNVYSTPQSYDVSNLSVYVDGLGSGSGSQSLEGVIYADSGGQPGALLAVSTALAVNKGDAAAWKDLVFGTPVTLPAGTYWIGVITGGTANIARDYYGSVAASQRNDNDVYSDGPSDPYGTATTSNAQLSLTASGNVTASAPPAFVSSSITNGQSLSGTVAWNVTTSGSVASVEYWADGSKIGTDTSSPYSYNLDTTAMANGSHQINVVVVGTDGSRVSAGNGGVLGTVTVTNTTAAKPGDLNSDGRVDVLDLSILLSNFSSSNAAADINKDGTVNILDLSVLLSNFG